MPARAFRNTNPPKNFHFSGPEALRAFFFPRQTVQIQEAAIIIGRGREALYKRQWHGDTSLKISKRPGGRQFILLEDLISYLFQSSRTENPESSETSFENYTNGVIGWKKRGRPHGSKNKPKLPVSGQEGGSR
jgi:hypothetical protein